MYGRTRLRDRAFLVSVSRPAATRSPLRRISPRLPRESALMNSSISGTGFPREELVLCLRSQASTSTWASRNRPAHEDTARPEWSNFSEAFLEEHARGPEPKPFRYRRHFLRNNRIRFDDFAASLLDRFEGSIQCDFCDAAPAVPTVHEEARDTPRFPRSWRRPHFPIADPCIDPRQLRLAAVLAPSDRGASIVD